MDQFVAHPCRGWARTTLCRLSPPPTHDADVARPGEHRAPHPLGDRHSRSGVVFGFLTIVFSQAIRAARRSRAPDRALACLVGCGYWLFHSSIDRFWELPALTGAALALPAIVCAPPSSNCPDSGSVLDSHIRRSRQGRYSRQRGSRDPVDVRQPHRRGGSARSRQNCVLLAHDRWKPEPIE